MTWSRETTDRLLPG